MNISVSLLNLVSFINMSAYHLRKTEVTYELKIRNLPTDGTAGECRKRLSQSLASNADIVESVVNSLDPEVELEECEGKYQDLSALVKDYEGNHNDNEHHRILARLWHLYLRVERIPIAASTDSDLDQTKESLLSRSKELLDSFQAAKPVDQPNGDRGSQEAVEVSDSLSNKPTGAVQQLTKLFELPRTNFEGEKERKEEELKRLKEEWFKKEEQQLMDHRRRMEESWRNEEMKLRKEIFRQKEPMISEVKGDSQSGLPNPTFQFEQDKTSRVDIRNSSRPKPVPVYKWGLKFDNSGPSIASFLERVEELRRARGVTHQELYESAVDLFSGPALVWFRAASSRIHSWHQLTRELREVFQPADYDLRLHQEIFNRVQGDNEPVDLYIAAMEGLYSRLATSVPEATRLAQIYNNLHPQLQDRLALSNIQTPEQLRSMGRRAEAGRLSMTRPRPTIRNENMLEPDLAYQDPTRRKTRDLQGRVAAVQAQTLRERKDVKCWNCLEPGHRFRFCRKPKKTFCYGCGRENVLKRDCAVCNPKNGLGREPATQ
jgi:hypothetical protein